MDPGEQSDMNSPPSFRPEVQPQYQSQYSYPHSSAAFSMDQDLNMGNDNFAATVQAQANTTLEPAVGDPSQAHESTKTGTTTTGMAPPQNANQPYSPGGARPSIDESQDGIMLGGDPKRKRSKVSRACDECRRKKVRCDAAADDGTIKTCSNCARAGLTCEYSRVPMKRGPSKGYIKELSERVQQVESLQMALSNTPGYRQSLDVAGGVYPEPPYSPDDPLSLKRNFSFSGEQKSPFVGPEYQRDRMPSVGGWNSASSHSAYFRSRDRGSIAVAPDQQPVNTMSFAKPFWSQDIEEPPPAKRLRMDEDETSKLDLRPEFLAKYYREFHPYLPILPEADAVVLIVKKASLKVQHAFLIAVRRLPSPKFKLQNGDAGDQAVRDIVSNVFKSNKEVDEFMFNAMREPPESRSTEDNLLYLWTYLLMTIEAENDLTRLHDGPLPRTIMIKQAVDLGWSCVTALCKHLTAESGPDAQPEYLQEFARAWHCSTIPARLHALAVGSGNPIPQYFHQYLKKRVPNLLSVLPSTGAIVALGTAQLTVVSCVVQDSLPASSFGRHMDTHHRELIQEGFDVSVGTQELSAGNEVLIEHLRLFLDLTLSRYTENFHPMDILVRAVAMAEALSTYFATRQKTFVYNPLQLHFFTLTTITLLEFLAAHPDTDIHKMAAEGVENVKSALIQVAKHDCHEDEQQHDDEKTRPLEADRKPMHWANALLRMISTQSRNAHDLNAHDEGIGEGTESRSGDGSSAAVDFSLLLRHGYLTVLTQQVT